jgi:hypothetical protein
MRRIKVINLYKIEMNYIIHFNFVIFSIFQFQFFQFCNSFQFCNLYKNEMNYIMNYKSLKNWNCPNQLTHFKLEWHTENIARVFLNQNSNLLDWLIFQTVERLKFKVIVSHMKANTCTCVLAKFPNFNAFHTGHV